MEHDKLAKSAILTSSWRLVDRPGNKKILVEKKPPSFMNKTYIYLSLPLLSPSYKVITRYLPDTRRLRHNFLSATEIIRRQRQRHPKYPATSIIGISYPLTNSLYRLRWSLDLILPWKSYNLPQGSNKQPKPQPYGGADIFLDFITKAIHEYLFTSIYRRVSIHRQGSFGHSYRGRLDNSPRQKASRFIWS